MAASPKTLWVPSTALRDALAPSQWPPTNAMCTGAPTPLSHACLGACRNGGHEPSRRLPSDSPALHLRHETATANIGGLDAFLRAASAAAAGGGACTVCFVGDSVSHDTFVAAFAGAWRRMPLESCVFRGPPACKPGSARGMAPCRTPPAAARTSLCHSAGHNFSLHPASSATFAVPSEWRAPRNASCASLTLQHMQLAELVARPALAASLLAGGAATTLLVNVGLCARTRRREAKPATVSAAPTARVQGCPRLMPTRSTARPPPPAGANRPAELAAMLDRHVRPLLTTLAALPAGAERATVLWRETTYAPPA